MRNIRNKITYYRNTKEMSQVDLADKLGISPSHLNKIEKGKKAPSLRLAIQIAHALDVKLDDLFFID